MSSPADVHGRAPDDAAAEAPDVTGAGGLSRREFAKRAGAGSVAAAGLVWAAPKISTIRYVRKAAAGSRPPTTPTTGPTAVPVNPLGDEITLSSTSPCVGADLRVRASGFEQGAGVALQIDSAAHPIGMVNADANGAVDVVVPIPTSVPTGPRILRAVGPKTGGTTLTLTTPVTIKTAAECAESDTPVDPLGAPAGSNGAGGSGGGGSLPLTGSDAIDLAVIGGAAALGGRILYGVSRRGDKALDGTDG